MIDAGIRRYTQNIHRNFSRGETRFLSTDVTLRNGVRHRKDLHFLLGVICLRLWPKSAL